jgi:hypothetical protein
MSNTNVPNMQSEDHDQTQYPEPAQKSTNQQAPVPQPPNASATVSAPTPAHRTPARKAGARQAPIARADNKRYGFRPERTELALFPQPAKVTKKPVHKPTARIQPKIDANSDEDISDDERVKTITVNQMSKKMTKLVGDVDDVAESYVVFLDQFYAGKWRGGEEVEGSVGEEEAEMRWLDRFTMHHAMQ